MVMMDSNALEQIPETQSDQMPSSASQPASTQASQTSSTDSTQESSTRSSIEEVECLSVDNEAGQANTQNGIVRRSVDSLSTGTSSQTATQTNNSGQDPVCHADGTGNRSIQPDPVIVERNDEVKEWRSWKIHKLYLSLLIFVETSFIACIVTLTIISHRNQGFARENQPPGFIRRNPGLRKAIWEQGIFYTALPAFVMTIYRTMWDACVMAFADRQPYVDLMKEEGRSPARTILLDYKMEPMLSRWALAFRNRHFLLSACMLSSLVLSFAVVPLTSFLLTMDTSLSNSTFTLTFDTYFDPRIFNPKIPSMENMPNVRLVLDTAAGAHLLNTSLPSHTDEAFAFPQYTTTLKDSEGSNLSFATTAYGVDPDCVEIPATEYNTTVRFTGTSMIIQVDAIDRMCAISDGIGIRTDPSSPDTFTLSWWTTACSIESGWTRISFLAARYDRPSQTVQNFTLLSCIPSYFTTSGELVQRSDSALGHELLQFTENLPSRKILGLYEILALKYYLEKEIHNLRYPSIGDPVQGNELAKNIYNVANLRNPNEPLRSDALLEATETMFKTVYAVFARLYLFKELETPLNETGVYMIKEKRLFIVPSVAYVILGILGITAILNGYLFRSATQKSMLKEEPYSLLSYAGLLYKTEIMTILMRIMVDEGKDPGRARETAKKMYDLDKVKWLYDRAKGRITFNGSLPMLAPEDNRDRAVRATETTRYSSRPNDTGADSRV